MKTDTPTIPPYIASFLWSYDTDALDIKTHKTLIIPQILNIGSQRAVAWLRDTYTSEEIADAVKESVATAWDAKSLALWSLVYDVAPKQSRFA
jgi:hypothetical protein